MKKISLFSILLIIITDLFMIDISVNAINVKPIKVGVLFNKEKIDFISQLKVELLKIEDKNKDTIDYLFYDANDSQELQNKQLDEVINMKVDLILLNIVDIRQIDSIINKIKGKNIPVIFFDREPVSFNAFKSYNKSLYIGTEACNAGKIKSDMIINEKKNGTLKDKNKNGLVDYVILEGDLSNIEACLRCECAIRNLNDNGIKTNVIATEVCNWERQCAKEKIEALFSKYGENIEVIVANNDDMAIGAIMALQEKGYNIGDPNKYVSVIGFGGYPEAVELIKKGFMTGTVFYNPEGEAMALYKIGLNLVEGKNPLENTEYKFDSTGVSVRIPFNGYIMR